MTLPESAAFRAYVEPARAGGAWWRVLLGLIVIGGAWTGFSFGMMHLAEAGILEPLGIDDRALLSLTAEGWTLSPDGVMVLMLTFLGLWVGGWAAVRAIHRRPFGGVLHPSGRMDRGNFARGASFAFAFLAVSLATYAAVLGPPQRTDLSLAVWAAWVVPIVLGICIQASSEEVLFRGYLLQHLAVWSRNPLIWAALPSLVFAVLHYDPDMEAGLRWRVLVQIGSFGLLAALLVWRTGGLGAAVGVHVANNILAVCLVGVEGAALGFELYLFPAGALHRMFAFDIALGALTLAAAFLLFRPEGTAP